MEEKNKIPDSKRANIDELFKIMNMEMYGYPVILISRFDFHRKGYDASDMKDVDMIMAASMIRKYLLDGVQFWEAVEETAIQIGLEKL